MRDDERARDLTGFAAHSTSPVPMSISAAHRETAAAQIDVVLKQLSIDVPRIWHRAPPLSDPLRWRAHVIDHRTWQVAQPVTFTPYAAAQPCSARCGFCSENLRRQDGGRAAATIRPQADYHLQLASVLERLRGVPMSYSLSGLETTDDIDWMMQTLDVLDRHGRHSPVPERVLYTNGAGLAGKGVEQIGRRLAMFKADWVEWSRHHFDGPRNQRIMRFREHIGIQAQDEFETSLGALTRHVPVKLVCIVQHGGIANTDDILAYLRWAHDIGVTSVIFREFSRLDDSYALNKTARYVMDHRVAMSVLLKQCLAAADVRRYLEFESATEGYYFWNLVARYRGMQVVFESSDYARMNLQHDSERIYKLVFHSNGNLCAGWHPDRQVVWRAPARLDG
jgi:hypothetical protein